MESSNVQECTQKKQCDMNDHVLGSSSNTSKIKRKKQKIQTRTFMDSDGYMQVCFCSDHDDLLSF